ncbi:hypothetical protein, partial [Escherichia coli]
QPAFSHLTLTFLIDEFIDCSFAFVISLSDAELKLQAVNFIHHPKFLMQIITFCSSFQWVYVLFFWLHFFC